MCMHLHPSTCLPKQILCFSVKNQNFKTILVNSKNSEDYFSKDPKNSRLFHSFPYSLCSCTECFILKLPAISHIAN